MQRLKEVKSAAPSVYVVELDRFLKEKVHTEDSIEIAESALQSLELEPSGIKKANEYKCKIYPVLLKNIFDKKETNQDDVNKAEDLIKQLQKIVNGSSAPQNNDALKLKLKEYENLLVRQQLFKKASGLGGVTCLFVDKDQAESGTLTALTSLTTLEETRQKLAETEEVGKTIIKNLEEQKATIKKASNNIQAVDSDLSYSSRLITKMGKWWR